MSRPFAFVRTAVCVVAAVVAVPRGVSAQDAPSPDGAATARLHLGAVALDPRLAIQDIGIDTNVFNDTSGGTRDVTATIGPSSTRGPGRAGCGQSASSLGWRYFRTSTSQRSFDASESARGDLDLGYFTPHVSGSLDRPASGPTSRSMPACVTAPTRPRAGVTVHAGAKLSIRFLAGARRRLEYDDGPSGA